MYKRMLVPLDGSQVAEIVLPYAKELGGRLGTEVVLLHIANPALRDYQPMVRVYVDHAAENVRGAVNQIWRQSHPSTAGNPPEVRGELLQGYPPDEILRYADENRIDLILVATHGRSGRKRWAMGSVADKVARSAATPVLLVPAGVPDRTPIDQWPSKSLIVPLDGSEMAETVLPHVEALAKGSGAKVALLRVCEPPAMPTYYSPELSEIPLHWGKYAQQETARCRQVSTEYLANVQKRLKAAGVEAESQILVGKASDEIVNYANKNPYGIVVMATHGRSGLSRLVYGSVALNIIVGVSSPILLVKPKPKA